MPKKVCFLIPGSADTAFFSQIAALSHAMLKLPWSRWQPQILAVLGGDVDAAALSRWRPHLDAVDIVFVSQERHSREGVWAQSDDVFRFAPRDADVLVAMDADTFPVAGFEDLLDEVLHQDAVAGVIAHYPLPVVQGATVKQTWAAAAQGLVATPPVFLHQHSLVDPGAPADLRESPFYVNFGVVFFARGTFDRVMPQYLALRPQLMQRLAKPHFSGQVGLTLAIAHTGARTRELPMRFNFPNDPAADARYPGELAHAVIFHYLRTEHFDRHKIFADAAAYQAFLAMPLQGSNLVFQSSVRRALGEPYPFG